MVDCLADQKGCRYFLYVFHRWLVCVVWLRLLDVKLDAVRHIKTCGKLHGGGGGSIASIGFAAAHESRCAHIGAWALLLA
jgi:hypothetical protein